MSHTGFICKKKMFSSRINWFGLPGKFFLRILQKIYEIQYLYICEKNLFVTHILSNANHMLVIVINVN